MMSTSRNSGSQPLSRCLLSIHKDAARVRGRRGSPPRWAPQMRALSARHASAAAQTAVPARRCRRPGDGSQGRRGPTSPSPAPTMTRRHPQATRGLPGAGAPPSDAWIAQTQPARARHAHVRADPLPSADPFGLISPRPSTHRVSTCSWAQCASNAPIDSTALDLQRAQRTGNCGAPFSPRLSGAVRPFLRVALRV